MARILVWDNDIGMYSDDQPYGWISEDLTWEEAEEILETERARLCDEYDLYEDEEYARYLRSNSTDEIHFIVQIIEIQKMKKENKNG